MPARQHLLLSLTDNDEPRGAREAYLELVGP
eukprot:CAMPEP_0180207986 /NCGR_PEP_ID=MMETSP0987-20121128/10478_1 /TAXON_ID=697907 /ORGANISM="non described non described, Strain CCMP2293" /LENGTH=30 /DNA_ID= /DNA_START= /DNA_END= /DNA_ORIENTATION=